MTDAMDPWSTGGLISEPFIDPQLLDDLTASREERRIHPTAFLLVILRRYWAEATPDEADADWLRTVRQNPAFAADVLDNLRQIVDDPPTHLATLIVVQARVIFYKEVGSRQQPYDDADYREWLRGVLAVWAKSYRDDDQSGQQ